jgi:hypothetical protein
VASNVLQRALARRQDSQVQELERGLGSALEMIKQIEDKNKCLTIDLDASAEAVVAALPAPHDQTQTNSMYCWWQWQQQ